VLCSICRSRFFPADRILLPTRAPRSVAGIFTFSPCAPTDSSIRSFDAWSCLPSAAYLRSWPCSPYPITRVFSFAGQCRQSASSCSRAQFFISCRVIAFPDRFSIPASEPLCAGQVLVSFARSSNSRTRSCSALHLTRSSFCTVSSSSFFLLMSPIKRQMSCRGFSSELFFSVRRHWLSHSYCFHL
jgi:hypothetical protein